MFKFVKHIRQCVFPESETPGKRALILIDQNVKVQKAQRWEKVKLSRLIKMSKFKKHKTYFFPQLTSIRSFIFVFFINFIHHHLVIKTYCKDCV